jgi:hypothetical protein
VLDELLGLLAQNGFGDVPERRVAEVVREAARLHCVGVD